MATLLTGCSWRARSAAISSAALFVCFMFSGMGSDREMQFSLYTP